MPRSLCLCYNTEVDCPNCFGACSRLLRIAIFHHLCPADKWYHIQHTCFGWESPEGRRTPRFLYGDETLDLLSLVFLQNCRIPWPQPPVRPTDGLRVWWWVSFFVSAHSLAAESNDTVKWSLVVSPQNLAGQKTGKGRGQQKIFQDHSVTWRKHLFHTPSPCLVSPWAEYAERVSEYVELQQHRTLVILSHLGLAVKSNSMCDTSTSTKFSTEGTIPFQAVYAFNKFPVLGM